MAKISVLDHGYVELIESWGSDERVIEAARQSTGKGFLGWGPTCGNCGAPKPVSGDLCKSGCGKIEKAGDEKLLKYLWKHHHLTPFEFGGIVIEMQLPIFVMRQFIRHRVLSTNEISGRYTPLPDLDYLPSMERLMMGSDGTNKQAGTIKGAYQLTKPYAEFFREGLKQQYANAQSLYETALQTGIPKELARIHLPLARYTRVREQANLRNWLGILTLRISPDVQWETVQYANLIADQIKTLFPRTWDCFCATY